MFADTLLKQYKIKYRDNMYNNISDRSILIFPNGEYITDYDMDITQLCMFFIGVVQKKYEEKFPDSEVSTIDWDDEIGGYDYAGPICEDTILDLGIIMADAEEELVWIQEQPTSQQLKTLMKWIKTTGNDDIRIRITYQTQSEDIEIDLTDDDWKRDFSDNILSKFISQPSLGHMFSQTNNFLNS